MIDRLKRIGFIQIDAPERDSGYLLNWAYGGRFQSSLILIIIGLDINDNWSVVEINGQGDRSIQTKVRLEELRKGPVLAICDFIEKECEQVEWGESNEE